MEAKNRIILSGDEVDHFVRRKDYTDNHQGFALELVMRPATEAERVLAEALHPPNVWRPRQAWQGSTGTLGEPNAASGRRPSAPHARMAHGAKLERRFAQTHTNLRR